MVYTLYCCTASEHNTCEADPHVCRLCGRRHVLTRWFRLFPGVHAKLALSLYSSSGSSGERRRLFPTRVMNGRQRHPFRLSALMRSDPCSCRPPLRRRHDGCARPAKIYNYSSGAQGSSISIQQLRKQVSSAQGVSMIRNRLQIPGLFPLFPTAVSLYKYNLRLVCR